MEIVATDLSCLRVMMMMMMTQLHFVLSQAIMVFLQLAKNLIHELNARRDFCRQLKNCLGLHYMLSA